MVKMKAVEDKQELPPDGSIDAGLLMINLLFPDGCPYSYEEIGFICGCSRSNIWQYEQNGLKKIKRVFEKIGRENLPR